MYLPSSFDGKYWMASFCVVLCQCVMPAKIQISSVRMHVHTHTHTHTHTLYQDVETVTVVWLHFHQMSSILPCLCFQSNLSGHKNIIGYVDSSLTHAGNGVYEVLLLMPYCRTHVLQIMNGR